MSKLDFTKGKLNNIVLELANLNGHDNPLHLLNELRSEVKKFNDYEFERDFYINMYHLFKDNANKFWNENHIQKITNWLNNSPVICSGFDTWWNDGKNEPALTHRLRAIIQYFKVQAKYEKQPTRQEQFKISKNYEKAWDSVNENSKTSKPISVKEIEKILPYLQDFPEALKLAQNKLSQFS